MEKAETLEGVPAPRPRGQGSNHAIAGLRGLAASSVVLFHTYEMSFKRGLVGELPSTWWGAMLHWTGGINVCLFFCISGFLIVGSLFRHSDVREFAINRVARIMPVFAILHLVMFTVGVAANYEWMGGLKGSPVRYVGSFLSNLLFLPGVFSLPLAQKNAWTLSYEALFYVLAALGFVAWRRAAWQRAVLGVAVVLAAGAFVFVHSLAAYFLVGVFAFWLLSGGRGEAFRRAPAWLGLVAWALGWYAFSVEPLYGLLPLGVAFLTLVYQRGWLSSLLSSSPLQALGRVSYSLYLVHPFVLDPIRSVVVRLVAPRLGNVPAALLFSLVGFSSAIAVAFLSYAWIEQRLTKRLFPHLSHGKRPAPAT